MNDCIVRIPLMLAHVNNFCFRDGNFIKNSRNYIDNSENCDIILSKNEQGCLLNLMQMVIAFLICVLKRLCCMLQEVMSWVHKLIIGGMKKWHVVIISRINLMASFPARTTIIIASFVP